MQAALQIILPILLFLTSVFLILLVLIQRGRGGGLAGAFGGLGGQSAFGTKAGDLFTRVTIIVSAFWIILCAASVKLLNDTGADIIDPTLGAGASALPEPGAGGRATTPQTKAAENSAAADTESSAPADTEPAAPAETRPDAPADDAPKESGQ